MGVSEPTWCPAREHVSWAKLAQGRAHRIQPKHPEVVMTEPRERIARRWGAQQHECFHDTKHFIRRLLANYVDEQMEKEATIFVIFSFSHFLSFYVLCSMYFLPWDFILVWRGRETCTDLEFRSTRNSHLSSLYVRKHYNINSLLRQNIVGFARFSLQVWERPQSVEWIM